MDDNEASPILITSPFRKLKDVFYMMRKKCFFVAFFHITDESETEKHMHYLCHVSSFNLYRFDINGSYWCCYILVRIITTKVKHRLFCARCTPHTSHKPFPVYKINMRLWDVDICKFSWIKSRRRSLLVWPCILCLMNRWSLGIKGPSHLHAQTYELIF